MKFLDYLIETSPGEFFCFCFSAEKKTFFILVEKVPRVLSLGGSPGCSPSGASLVPRVTVRPSLMGKVPRGRKFGKFAAKSCKFGKRLTSCFLAKTARKCGFRIQKRLLGSTV